MKELIRFAGKSQGIGYTGARIYSPTEYAHYQAVVNAVIKGAPVTWVTCVASLLQNSTVWEVLSELLS